MSRFLTLVLASLLAPSLALAQGAPTKDKEAVVFDEIERGLFFGVAGGAHFLLNPPASKGPRPFSPGQMGSVEIGYEIGQRLALSVFFMGTANRAGAEYIGMSNGTASGDFSSFIPGVAARVNAVGFNDAQGVQRTWLYVRGGAGYAMFSPKKLLPDSDILGFVGPGVEYFTRLRHFSIALEATGSYLVSSGTIGFSVTPSVRYAF